MKKNILIAIAVIAFGIFLAPKANADTITFDASSTAVFNGFTAGKTVTSSIVVGNNTNRIVLECASIWQDVGGTGTISTTTLNNAALTKVVTSTRVAGGSMAVEAWYQLAPAVGTLKATTTVSGNIDGVKIVWSSFFGVDQTTPIDATSTNNGSTAGATTTITTVNDNAVINECISLFGTATLTAKAGQTVIYNDKTGSIDGAGSYKAAASHGSFTVGWTWAGANDWVEAAISLKAAVTAVGTPGIVTWLVKGASWLIKGASILIKG